MSDFYDRRGEGISLGEWARLIENPSYKIVARTELPDGVVVSTVWLGMDHRIGGDGPPIIFETMVFGGPNSEDQYRWGTEEEARAGHEMVVQEQNVVVLHEVRDRGEVTS